MELSAKLRESFGERRLVAYDSRKIKGGEIFFAIPGVQDGNDFAGEALDRGAAFAVVDKAAVLRPGDDRFIVVSDALIQLQALARYYRRQFRIPVLGLTGTNGKTTTKELLSACLATTFRTHANIGNLNNQIGVPETLLAMPPGTEFAVIEMGASKPGDIAELCRIAEPTMGLITNIGTAHMQGFGDEDSVKKTKGELFDFIISTAGKLWVNETDLNVKGLAANANFRCSYGDSDSDFRMSDLQISSSGLKMKISGKGLWEAKQVESHLGGEHNAINILAAFSVAVGSGVNPVLAAKAIGEFQPRSNRSQWLESGETRIFLDAYNANPDSMRAAIRFICEVSETKPVLILGDMKELGGKEADYHSELGQWMNSLPVGQLIAVGPLMKHAVESFRGKVIWFENVQLAKELAGEILKKPGMALIKGSRGMELEKLLDGFGR